LITGGREDAMMGAQEMSGSGGWSQGDRGGEVRRGPGMWAALLAFGLLVVMTVGSVKVLRERAPATGESEIARHHDDSVDAVSIMGARRFDAGEGEFRTVDAVAIMGESTVDLRNARLSGERAVIDAVAIMGRVEILVPPDWEVTTGDLVAAGSVGNMARRSDVANPKKVKVDGFVFMGRLDVHR
jgi:predicted membrane protein